MNADKWIEALQHPLVLAGFGLFIFAALIKPLFLNNRKLSGTAMERLLVRGMNFAFILALLAMAGGLFLGWRANPAGGEKKETVVAPANQAERDSGSKTAVEQVTQGEQSAAINSGGDVQINYGSPPSGEDKAADKKNAGAVQQQVAPDQIKQSTWGDASPAIHTQGNVEVNYAK